MVNSISVSYVRSLCDKIGFNTKVNEDGDIILRLDADSDFGHDVIIFLQVTDDKLLRVFAMTDIKIPQSNVGKTLIKLNEYNNLNLYMKAYLLDDGHLVVERHELIDENVSEEFIKENCIKLCISSCWQFFKKNFADY